MTCPAGPARRSPMPRDGSPSAASGRVYVAFITVVDPRFNNQVIEINTETDLSTKPLSVALQPARTMTGRVTYADTGKPAARARVQIAGFDQFQSRRGSPPGHHHDRR